MPSFDVSLRVNVAGVGQRDITRVIVAPTLEEAVTAAKADLLTVVTISVVPSAA